MSFYGIRSKTITERVSDRIGKVILKIYFRIAFKVDVLKKEQLPTGPKIFVANHPSTTDPFLILILFKCRMTILIKETLFKIPVFGRILKISGHIPVIKGSGYLALEKARLDLKKGKSVLLFIEGGLSPSETAFLEPKTGAARLALLSGCPVIPVGLGLAYSKIKVMETQIRDVIETASWYTSGPYAVTVGERMVFQGDVENQDKVREITDKIMKKVKNLSKMSRQRLQKIKNR